jgi:SAM-dependent methyltransferase
MNTPFEPLYQGERPLTTHPHDAMSAEVGALWAYFTQTLGWGAGLHSRVTFDFLVNALEFARGKPVLDAGAGHQRYRRFFDGCVYLTQEHPSGIEMKKMQGIEYDLVSPIDERIPLKDGTLAAVISTSVLEHVRHPVRFLAEACRVLHPGGRIYIHVPFAYNEHETPYDFQRPTRYGLQAWLAEAGFDQASVLPASNSCYGASTYLLHAMKKEMVERGHGQRFVDLAPIVKYCIDTINAATDDHLDTAALMPVGWVAVAQKQGHLGDFPTWNRAEWLQACRT